VTSLGIEDASQAKKKNSELEKKNSFIKAGEGFWTGEGTR